jgi:hypothetical protein
MGAGPPGRPPAYAQSMDRVLAVGDVMLDRDALERLASDEAATKAGAWSGEGAAVAFAALADLVGVGDEITHATFHASDGYAASVPLDQARRDAIVVVPPASAGRTGVRLVVADGSTKCLNVKAVQRVELTAGMGKHTVNPDPHKNPAVPGWDG